LYNPVAELLLEGDVKKQTSDPINKSRNTYAISLYSNVAPHFIRRDAILVKIDSSKV
jgi:hypothetical protein